MLKPHNKPYTHVVINIKEMKKIALLVCLLTFVNCKLSWVEKNEKEINENQEKIILVDRFDKTERKDHYLRSTLYKSEKFKILKTEFFSDTLMRTGSETYLKDNLLIKEATFGIVALSPPTDKNSPYAKVFEEIYYFNSSKNGILKKKEIKIKNFGEYEEAKSKLTKMKFQITEINQKDYMKVIENYEQIMKLYKNAKHKNNDK